ncbi:MAG: MlaD family protein [Solirubrobacterales bacterium]|nr:MlaD family protein [Solirubrobacterales bacterium]
MRLGWWRRHDDIPVVELHRSKPVRFGAVVLVVLAVLLYFGFTKAIPFKKSYVLKAQFTSALKIHPSSPVRIAGVAVGQVTGLRREGRTGLVTMEIQGNGLPIHSDATLKIRPRIFLEGNFFVELQPGSPSAPDLPSGSTIPVTHTAVPVQLDQLLDALNTDTRANLQEFLHGYGESLTHKPNAAENAEQEPEVRGLNGAQALNLAYQRGPKAFKGSTIVAQAFNGVEQHDISHLIANTRRLTRELNVHESELGEWVDNFDTFLHNFAAEASSLHEAVARFPKTLSTTSRAFVAIRAAFPEVRTFSRAFAPGVAEFNGTIDAALPWIDQVKASLAPNEVGGLAQALRSATPAFAQLVAAQPAFYRTQEQFSKCLTNVFFPAGNTKLQDGSNTAGVPDYLEFWYALTGFAGLGQGFDGNGPRTSFVVGGGGQPVLSAPVTTIGGKSSGEKLHLIARAAYPPLGTRPRLPASEPPYKPLVPCSTQRLQSFNGPLSTGPADGSG